MPESRSLSSAELWREIDRRYFAFATQLEYPLSNYALERRLFLSEGSSGQITSLREMPALAISLPWIFVEAFPTASVAELFDIAEAGTLLNLSFMVHDNYVDGQLPHDVGITLLQQQLYTTSVRKFHHLFDARSAFWTYFDRYQTQLSAALLEEMLNHWGHVTTYPVEAMHKVGSGKAAVVKVGPMALALRAGEEHRITAIETAIDAFAAAVLLADDIADWAEDYRHKRYTLPLTQAIPIEHWPAPRLTLQQVGRRFEHSVILERLLLQVLAWCQQAREALGEPICPRWSAFVGAKEADIEQYRRSSIAAKVLRRLTGQTVW